MDASKDTCPICGNRRLWGCPYLMGRRKYFLCGTIVDEQGEIHMDEKVCKRVAGLAAKRKESQRG